MDKITHTLHPYGVTYTTQIIHSTPILTNLHNTHTILQDEEQKQRRWVLILSLSCIFLYIALGIGVYGFGIGTRVCLM